jgi:REP element-mobilizing transposase RayT
VTQRPTPRHRRSIRLEGYDYASAGAYFVTIVTAQRKALFEHPVLSRIAGEQWAKLADRFPTLVQDEFVIMPNHIHFIIWLVADGTNPALGSIVGAYKSLVAINWLKWLRLNDPDRPGHLWQHNYYERIIRNGSELNGVREYIRLNPERWQLDADNPDRVFDEIYDREWGWLEGGGPNSA